MAPSHAPIAQPAAGIIAPSSCTAGLTRKNVWQVQPGLENGRLGAEKWTGEPGDGGRIVMMNSPCARTLSLIETVHVGPLSCSTAMREVVYLTRPTAPDRQFHSRPPKRDRSTTRRPPRRRRVGHTFCSHCYLAAISVTKR